MLCGGSNMDNARCNLHGYVDSGNDILGNIPNETPLALDLVGHFSYSALGKEGDLAGVHERERSSMWRFVISPSITTLNLLKSGMLLRIAYLKDPITRAWKPLSPQDQYKIDFVTQTLPTSPEVILSLSKVSVS